MPLLSAPADAENEPIFFTNLLQGFTYYYFTSLIVLLAALAGHEFLTLAAHPLAKRRDFVDSLANWDGEWYARIVESGYAYDPATNSNVAFFPAFPLLGRWLADLTGLSANLALLLLAHLCLAVSFVLMMAYVRQRFGAHALKLGPWVLLSMGLFPATFFFRMAYSESLFLLIIVLALYGIQRKWSLPFLALLVGLATAIRPVGVALLPPLLLHLWFCSASWKGFILRCMIYGPLACWGLVGFILFQWLAFEEPFAFAKTQAHWRARPAVSLPDRLFSVLILEPLWSVIDPSSPCFWERHEPNTNPLFSLHLANPIYFLLSIALVIFGSVKRWLDRNEWLLAAGLLLIPYLTRSHEMCMGSMARFTAVVFPIYLVVGQILIRLPAPAAAIFLIFCAFFMALYTSLFVTWHRIF